MITPALLANTARWRKVGSTWVEPGTGAAVEVRRGQLVALALHERPQVVDVNIFRQDDPRETFGASVTRPIHGTHVEVGDELLSVPPWERPLARVVGDTVAAPDGSDARAPRSHDLLFGRCSSALRRHLYGEATPGCQENLAAAIAPFGLTEHDVHDPLNVFMHTGVEGRDIFFVPPVARGGDVFVLEMLADCLVAASACPGMSSGPSPGGVEISTYAAVSPGTAPAAGGS